MVDVIKRRITGVSDDSPADGQVEIDMANISPASFFYRACGYHRSYGGADYDSYRSGNWRSGAVFLPVVQR